MIPWAGSQSHFLEHIENANSVKSPRERQSSQALVSNGGPSASAFLQLFSKSRTELATRRWCNFPLEGDRNCGARPRAWYSTLPKMVHSEGPSASRLFPAGG